MLLLGSYFHPWGSDPIGRIFTGGNQNQQLQGGTLPDITGVLPPISRVPIYFRPCIGVRS